MMIFCRMMMVLVIVNMVQMSFSKSVAFLIFIDQSYDNVLGALKDEGC